MRPLLGTWPITQACALTGNRTSDPLSHRPGTQSTEIHQPGLLDAFKCDEQGTCDVIYRILFQNKSCGLKINLIFTDFVLTLSETKMEEITLRHVLASFS